MSHLGMTQPHSPASIPRERNTPPLSVTIYFSSKSHNPGVLRIDRRNCIVGYKLLLPGWIPRPVTTEPPLWAGLSNVVPDTNNPLLGNGPPASPLAPYWYLRFQIFGILNKYLHCIPTYSQ